VLPLPCSIARRWAASVALACTAALLLLPQTAGAEEARLPPPSFANGFPADDTFFPVGVWLQNPRNAALYSAIGINTYVGLWSGPTEEALAELDRHGLLAVVEPTPLARTLRNARVIRAWLQPDEPDNAQSNGRGGYGDCILPEEVVNRYRLIRELDATRPVLLNFGQAVANPRWFGRGHRCSMIAPEAYYRPASRGADIVSFDIYPAAEERQDHVKGRLELVGEGVANLRRWAGPGRPVWAAIETTHINNPTRRPLPEEVKSEVWMALVHGARGIFYFVHEWQPSFREDGIFRYPDTVAAVARINAQIRALAPVLNAPSEPPRAIATAPVKVATLEKRHQGVYYLFAVNLERKPARVRLALGEAGASYAIVLGEDRTVAVMGGAIEEDLEAYGVRLYKVPARP